MRLVNLEDDCIDYSKVEEIKCEGKPEDMGLIVTGEQHQSINEAIIKTSRIRN